VKKRREMERLLTGGDVLVLLGGRGTSQTEIAHLDPTVASNLVVIRGEIRSQLLRRGNIQIH
jgi:hypothetical protein